MMLELINQDVKRRVSLHNKVKIAILSHRFKITIQKVAFRIPFVWIGLGIALTMGLMESGMSSLSLWARGNEIELPVESELEQILISSLFDPQEKEIPYQPPKAEQFPELALRTYKLKPGETLQEVARKHGIRLDTLISMNEITDARKIPAGTELIIPNKDGILYKVNRGDSLSKISALYNTNVRYLVDTNDLGSSIIHPGMKLFIPGARLPEMELKRILGDLFLFPTSGRITSTFGVRADPFTGVRRFHNGLDIANDPGTPVHAAMAGKVVKIGIHPSYGRYIILTHDGGFQTFYAHLQTVLVAHGKFVAQGEVIGEMGSTGYSTGSHLHFSVFKNGNPVDPIQFFR
ncbi:MAG: M23 family metallopeptidase [Spirochaetes bacterium]|nr:M23 family metallopeptidase [Spirochaetota bacterium]